MRQWNLSGKTTLSRNMTITFYQRHACTLDLSGKTTCPDRPNFPDINGGLSKQVQYIQSHRYRKVPNKGTCLNKRAPSTLGWDISLKIGKNWSKITKIGFKTPKMLPWTSWIHQGVCQRAGRVYSAFYGSHSVTGLVAIDFRTLLNQSFDLK